MKVYTIKSLVLFCKEQENISPFESVNIGTQEVSS